jgi:CheY-like chemotaxis protein
MLLETEGYEVVGEAPDGEARLELAGELKPDVVLLDLGLPGIDGFEVARRMAPGPAIVLVSSRDKRDIGPLDDPVKGFIAKGELSGDALREVARHVTLRARLWLVGIAGLRAGGSLRGGHRDEPSRRAARRQCGLRHADRRRLRATGLYAWSRRPDNRVGLLMVATGFAWSAVGLSQANSPLVFSIGWAVGPLYLVFVTWLVLVFPRRCDPVAHRALVADRRVHRRARHLRARCLLDISTKDVGDDVPDNLFAIVHAPGVAGVFDTASAAIGAIIIGWVVALTVLRRRAASPVVRRASRPVLLTGLVCLSFVSLSLAVASLNVSDVVHGIFGSLALARVPAAAVRLPPGPAAQPLRARRHRQRPARRAELARRAARHARQGARRPVDCASSTGPVAGSIARGGRSSCPSAASPRWSATASASGHSSTTPRSRMSRSWSTRSPPRPPSRWRTSASRPSCGHESSS